VSSRSQRGRQDTPLPGIPDALNRVPPKAKEYQALTLDQAVDRAHAILDRVLAGATVPAGKGTGKRRAGTLPPPDQVLVLFSGGGDSSILAHLMRERANAMAHVDTGVSIPACGEYVRAVAAEWRVPLHVTRPDDTYRDLVLGRVLYKTGPKAGTPMFAGFPGPAAHALMYQRLKERALERLRTELVGRRGRAGQLVFVGGMRWAESARRFRNASEVDPWGAVVWCSPIVWWTDAHMAEYRDRYLCHELHEHAPHRLCRLGVLPRSVVTEHLHMSGDCLCGAFAKPGELDEIAFFWPEVADRLRALQREAVEAGVRRCQWGAGSQLGDDPASDAAPGPLCARCVPQLDGQLDILDHWAAEDLLTPTQLAALRPQELITSA
jgi:hypothetical protein